MPQKTKSFTCADAIKEAGRIKTSSINLSGVVGLGLVDSAGTWVNERTGTHGNLQTFGFSEGLSAGANGDCVAIGVRPSPGLVSGSGGGGLNYDTGNCAQTAIPMLCNSDGDGSDIIVTAIRQTPAALADGALPQKVNPKPAPKPGCPVTVQDSQATGAIAGATVAVAELGRASVKLLGRTLVATLLEEGVAEEAATTVLATFGGPVTLIAVGVGVGVYAYDRYSGDKVTMFFQDNLGLGSTCP